VKTTPKPSATKNNKGELVPLCPPWPDMLDGDGLTLAVDAAVVSAVVEDELCVPLIARLSSCRSTRCNV